MRVRVMIGDPIAASIVYSAELPAQALEGQVCTTGNGVYMRFENGAWAGAKLQLDDVAITMLAGKGTVFDRALRCVDALVARLNPLDYITGGSAGGQSVSFPSASDVLAFFKMKREAIASMGAASGNVRSVRVKPFPVGGVYG
jgi:hypothetical protein